MCIEIMKLLFTSTFIFKPRPPSGPLEMREYLSNISEDNTEVGDEFINSLKGMKAGAKKCIKSKSDTDR